MTVLMSFWPSVYNKIIEQKKIIEYRRTFPKKCTYAYMYVSKPVKAICGIIYFGEKHNLNEWKKEYSNFPDITNKIHLFSEKYNYGTEIIGVQKIRPISLEDLRTNIPEFVAPQSYILLENKPVLNEYISKNTVFIENRIENDLTNIFPEHICKEY